jgi:hypothetical protein
VGPALFLRYSARECKAKEKKSKNMKVKEREKSAIAEHERKTRKFTNLLSHTGSPIPEPKVARQREKQ